MYTVKPILDSFTIERLRAQALDGLTGGTGRANPETLRALEAAVAKVVECAEPQGIYERVTMEAADDSTVTTRDGEIRSAMFSRVARAAEGDRVMVLFTIATLGGTFDEALEDQESLLDKFVLDAVGSELAEIVADLVEEEWKDAMAQTGLDASLRMSPGYCDWALDGQNVIFTTLDSSAIGVRLTENYLMIPAKSVSGAAVVARRVPLKVPCEECARPHCPFRRAPRDADPGEEQVEDSEEGLSA